MSKWTAALAGMAKTGMGLIDSHMKEEADIRAADRKLADAERLMAIQETANARAQERSFKFETNPDNVTARANADATALGIKSKAQTDADIQAAKAKGGDVDYLDARKNLVASEQAPEREGVKTGRDIENSLKQIQLDQANKLLALRDSYSKAIESGDKVAANKIADQISGMNFTGHSKDTSTYLHAGVQLLKAAKDADSPEEAKRMVERGNTLIELGLGGKGAQSGATQAPTGAPQVGTVVDGFRFKGGNPKDQKNWEPAGQEKSATKKAQPAPSKPGGLINSNPDPIDMGVAEIDAIFEKEVARQESLIMQGKMKDYTPEVKAKLELIQAESRKKSDAKDALARSNLEELKKNPAYKNPFGF